MIFSSLLISLLLTTTVTTEDLLQAARQDFEAGRYSTAVKTLTGALSTTSPQAPALHFWLARTYYEMRDFDNAVNHAETAVKLDPQNAEYNRWLGRAYGEKADQSHSFFLARKVKQAFEAAVHLAPSSIAARRDLMQYLVEAPWIVGGDKQKAREQIDAIAKLDAVEGRLARATYFSADKKWKEAETEYLAVIDARPAAIEPYMEAAHFFADRKDQPHLDRAIEAARRVGSRDPRVDYFHAISLILHRDQLPLAEKLLRSYIANVPEKSDFPSHHSAMEWLSRINL